MSAKRFTSWHSMTSTHYDSLTGYLQIRRGTFTLTMCESVGKCSLHSFYYIFFDLLSLQLPTSLAVVSKRTDYIPGTKVPRNICSRERKFSRTFVPRSESSRELSFLGAKVPTGKLPGSEKSWYGSIPNRPTLVTSTPRSDNVALLI